MRLLFVCAQDWNRTSTPVKAADFESAASTNSATWAFSELGAQYYNFCLNHSKYFLAESKDYLQQLFLGSSMLFITRHNAFHTFIMLSCVLYQAKLRQYPLERVDLPLTEET